MEIGIIGFGNFGRLMAKHLAWKADVFVTDRQVLDANIHTMINAMGVKYAPIDEILSKKIIILSIPMENFIKALRYIKDTLRPGTLVLDVCSLKMFACEAMDSILPNNIEIIGTHPLFGPQTAQDTLKDSKIVLCNVRSRIETIRFVQVFCESLGLRVFLKTPEEHDKQMARSQALTHFIGTIIRKMQIKRVELGTKTFDKMMDVMDVVSNNTPALFNNMQTMNPFTREMREEFLEFTKKLNEELINIEED